MTHTLEEESPLFNFTPGQLLKAKMELIVCLEVGINIKMIIMIMMRTIARVNFCLGVIINQGIMITVNGNDDDNDSDNDDVDDADDK